MTMIHAGDLERLLALEGQGGPVVSLYLNVTPPRPFKSELHSLIHEKREKLAEAGVEKDLRRRIDEVLEEIRAHVDGIRTLEGTRLLSIFATPDGFWQEYRLPVALPSRLYVEPDPYIRPLTTLLDEFDRYCVLVVDARKARIFTMYLGEIEEHVGLLESDTPSWISEGDGRAAKGPFGTGVAAWAGWRESKIQRHIQDHVHRHLKQVAERTFRVFKRMSFDRLIVGAPEGREGKIYPMLERHLHSYLQGSLAGVFSGDPGMSEHELKKRALEVTQAHERVEEERLIARLLSESERPDGMAVLGIARVLPALMLGQVHTLVVDHAFQTPGRVCPVDHYLSLSEDRCPLCEGELAQVEDFIDEVVEEAIAQGAEVEHVFTEHEAFSAHGIGAILRFRI
jgi:peptide subunit release factor 1 (eRF1)